MSMRDDQLDVLNVGEQSYDYYRIADLEGIDHFLIRSRCSSRTLFATRTAPTSPTST